MEKFGAFNKTESTSVKQEENKEESNFEQKNYSIEDGGSGVERQEKEAVLAQAKQKLMNMANSGQLNDPGYGTLFWHLMKIDAVSGNPVWKSVDEVNIEEVNSIVNPEAIESSEVPVTEAESSEEVVEDGSIEQVEEGKEQEETVENFESDTVEENPSESLAEETEGDMEQEETIEGEETPEQVHVLEGYQIGMRCLDILSINENKDNIVELWQDIKDELEKSRDAGGEDFRGSIHYSDAMSDLYKALYHRHAISPRNGNESLNDKEQKELFKKAVEIFGEDFLTPEKRDKIAQEMIEGHILVK